MDNRALSLVRWYGALLWRRAGWQAMLGLAALIVALGLAWQGQRLAAQSIQLRRQAAELPAELPETPLAQGNSLAAERLASFNALLMPRESLPEQIRQLFALAAKNGVQLARGEYRPVPDLPAGLVRYQITLPAQADAAGLQRFLLAALAQMPALALDSIALKRETTQSGQLEARLRLALLVKAQ